MKANGYATVVYRHPIQPRPLACELHIRKRARELYEIEGTLLSYSGNVIFADIQAARDVAYRMNRMREEDEDDQPPASAADLHAIGLLDEITHHVISRYREETGSRIFAEARRHIEKQLGEQRARQLLSTFLADFPPRAVHNGEQSVEEYLADSDGEMTGADRALEELVVLWVENLNPALRSYRELFDDRPLAAQSAYADALAALQDFFKKKPAPAVSDGRDDLLTVLLRPAREYPDSLESQLAYVRTKWSRYLGNYLYRLLRSLDLIREEHKPVFAGPGPTQVYDYTEEDQVARFSPDRDWMPNVVMIAKSALVWLDQLSRFYSRRIDTLAAIPDEELDRLARSGFNALWLIGIWRRSPASKRIKQLCGNPEAEASAYSLLDYDISERVGGWHALEELRRRCTERGIQLASDMVPNHTGIDSAWVLDHPDWFLQLEHPPFPGYSFEGENLSGRPDVGIYLENHYYDRSDAAVVFKRVDHDSGHTRYLYHGNDGTGMPWNDTAQLNFLNSEAREAVVQTILHVARNFPIIRFDAAMTLAKKHYRRLWFPEPGSGGDIPSRSEVGMTDAEFEEAMPREFWREVVDRVAAEAPNTLLLAEAFWMMESYFVRTLGMHRVYNSAFMNMLKNEENAKYRQTIKNTLEFDKNILKRFVNFMNNPDEDTARAQFGNGDKYFAVCTLMVTMPGLPMFGHGQIEGFEEKYGMEYGRAYWNESPDIGLVERHEREIFPLARRRYIFSEVENFLLYDLYGDDDRVQENVFAYSNAAYDKRSLVIVNNAYERSWGWLRYSAAYVEEDGSGERQTRHTHIAEALGLSNDFTCYCIFREQRSGKWYIRNSAELYQHGLYIGLDGYGTQVYLDIYEIADSEHSDYAQLSDYLRGAGVESIERAMKELYLRPLHAGFSAVANSSVVHGIAAAVSGESSQTAIDPEELTESYARFLSTVEHFADGVGDRESAVREFYRVLSAVCELRHLDLLHSGRQHRRATAALTARLRSAPHAADALIAYSFVRPLEFMHGSGEVPARGHAANHRAASCLQEWLLADRLDEISGTHFEPSEDARARLRRIELLIAFDRWAGPLLQGTETPMQALARLCESETLRDYLGINSYNGVEWFHKERFENLAYWLFVIAVTRVRADGGTDAAVVEGISRLYAAYEAWEDAAARSEYKLSRLLKPAPQRAAAGKKGAAGSTKSGAGTKSGATGKKSGGKRGEGGTRGKGGNQGSGTNSGSSGRGRSGSRKRKT